MSGPLSQFTQIFSRRNMSASLTGLLEREELHGQRIANRIRYLFAGLMYIWAVVTISTGTGDPFVNLGLITTYLLLTVAHTLILAKPKWRGLIGTFQYLTIFLDCVLITTAMVFYTHTESPNNYAFAIKNPVLWYYFLPLFLTLLQFRVKPVVFALFLIAAVYYTFVGLTFHHGVELTQNWNRYINGPAVLVEDFVLSRMLVFIGGAVVILYTIYRALFMLRRLGAIEAQKSNLARYFSPEIVEAITENPDSLPTGGRQRVTVLFSDIRNFTKMSEGMDAQELADFLGEFRERMSRAIFSNGGTLDKFIGDAIMATFGTPHPSAEPGRDAQNALAASRMMLEELEGFNGDRRQAGQAPIYIGIGLHTGEVFAGNVGTGSRLEYTVIGDGVNTASRIESLCKKLNAMLLISQATFDETGQPEDAERMPRVMVKGKQEPLQVYRLRELPG